MQEFGPQGELERQRLLPLREAWTEEAALLAWLADQGAEDPPLRPLHRVLARRVSDLKQELAPRLAAAGLDPLPARVAARGDQSRLFDLLWEESDPDTAAWVLMLERQRRPEQYARRRQDSHPERIRSAVLRSQLKGEPVADQPLLEALTHWPMFADVPPSVLIWLAARGTQRPFTPGEVVLEEGSPSDHLALVLAGDVRVQLSGEERVTLGPGQVVGEIGVITSQPRTASVVAGPEGCRLFVLPATAFEDLLRRSDAFSRSLLAQLARRLAETTRRPPDPLHGS